MLGGGVDAATLVCSHLPGCLFTACVWARGQTGGWRAVICSQHLCSSVHTSLVACSQRLFGREAILAVGEQLFVHNTFVPLFTPPWLSVHSVCLGARPIGGWRAAICSQHLCSSVHTSLVACSQRVLGREANWRLASSYLFTTPLFLCSHLPGCLFTACVWARGQLAVGEQRARCACGDARRRNPCLRPDQYRRGRAQGRAQYRRVNLTQGGLRVAQGRVQYRRGCVHVISALGAASLLDAFGGVFPLYFCAVCVCACYFGALLGIPVGLGDAPLELER